MKFAYQFSNLLGSVYRKGNITFTPDGNSVISPVGNRISIFDLKNNKSQTLPVETRVNVTSIAVSPDGRIAILVTEEGEGLLVSLVSQSVLGHYHFHKEVRQVQFSPDGSKFAVVKDTVVQVFYAPGKTREFNPFVLYRTYPGHVDEAVCLDWTSDSRVLCTGSKDRRTRIVATQRLKNLNVYDLGGVRDTVIGAFFALNSMDIYCVARDAYVFVWKCDTKLSDLEPWVEEISKNKEDEDEDDDDADEDTGSKKKSKKKRKIPEAEPEQGKGIIYSGGGKFSFREARKDTGFCEVTTAAFHKASHLLVTGFEDGTFFLHEMPDFNMIHSLSISEQSVNSMAINNSGEWIALACGKLGQLLVWEWQSESYVLKQQGHFNDMTCITYSPDGQNIVTGGGDGKVKVWNSFSGFCFVTFTEHVGEVTGVKVTQNGKSVLSSSMDGTVRAFDLTRYRNYKTLTSPKPDQFSCLAVDGAGEIVCAGGTTEFMIYVWTMKTGRLLQTLAGHEGPISALDFSQSDGVLASGSWDKTVKLWGIYEQAGMRETIDLNSDVLALTFRPDGKEFAVATLNAHVTFWDTVSAQQKGTIEGRHDLGYSRKDADKVSAKTSAEGKAFETLCYSADGHCILAAGRSKNVCIYSVSDQLLMKKFVISCNHSLDGIEEFLDRRKMTEWGSLALVDTGQGDEKGSAISLPGVKKGDHSSRHWKPEVRVYSLQFSPTGRSWVACSTEGLMVYSLDQGVVFDPFELDMDITPASVRRTLGKGEHSAALMLSFRLNEQSLIQEVLEAIPVDSADVIIESLPDTYVDKLLAFMGHMIESSAHIEFYLLWLLPLLTAHGPKLKQRSQSVMSSLRTLQRNLTRKYEDLRKIADHNKYLSQYLQSLSQLKRKKPSGAVAKEVGQDSDEDDDSEDENLKELAWREGSSDSDSSMDIL
ncbi:periodic tryptophan protein 2 homolog [Aplysia californica]|uniref:Periodic tryptophan protein 2 homolog n=1 Tax=Aplysia californica TaxID=6500 RepID=A0ABM0JWD8_APLCA|nr:periodic tryptophan protein 2 homolog [Aplysia californica]